MSQAADAAPGPDALADALEATWPPVRRHAAPDWQVAEGGGGGKRVSAATATREDADPEALADAQAALGQPPLAMILPGQGRLDATLEAAGFAMLDPTVALSARTADLARPPPPVTVFTVDWPPLACQRDIWAAGGIGPARVAVMDRVATPRTALLGRLDDTPAASAFVALAGRTAMVHALEVLPWARRRGLARHMMATAAIWAQAQGADTLCALVTRANAPALALYRGMGMVETGSYHYRIRHKEAP